MSSRCPTQTVGVVIVLGERHLGNGVENLFEGSKPLGVRNVQVLRLHQEVAHHRQPERGRESGPEEVAKGPLLTAGALLFLYVSPASNGFLRSGGTRIRTGDTMIFRYVTPLPPLTVAPGRCAFLWGILPIRHEKFTAHCRYLSPPLLPLLLPPEATSLLLVLNTWWILVSGAIVNVG